MAKVELHENSLDSSGDGEILGMVDEGSFESAEDRNSISRFLSEEDVPSYNIREYKDIAGVVTYKFLPMTSGEEAVGSQAAGVSPQHTVLPGGEYFLIGNPVDVFGNPSGQKKVSRSKENTMQPKVVTKKRDDKRRATHNEVERRRRDKINSWITKLAALIPNSNLPDSASKGGILAKACDYIVELTGKQKRSEKLEKENDKFVQEILRLNQEISELRKENSSLRNQLMDRVDVKLKMEQS